MQPSTGAGPEWRKSRTGSEPTLASPTNSRVYGGAAVPISKNVDGCGKAVAKSPYGSLKSSEQPQTRNTAHAGQAPIQTESAGPSSGAGENINEDYLAYDRPGDFPSRTCKASRQPAFEAAKRAVAIYPFEILQRKKNLEYIGSKFEHDVIRVLEDMARVDLDGMNLFTPKCMVKIEQNTGLRFLDKGYAGGIKAVHKRLGLFFKFALDDKSMYGSNRMAAKVAKREAAASRWVHVMDSVHVSTPLLVCADVRLNRGRNRSVVVRVQAFAEIEVESSSTEEGSGTLRVGSPDGGITIHRDEEQMYHVVKELARHFYVQENKEDGQIAVIEHAYSRATLDASTSAASHAASCGARREAREESCTCLDASFALGESDPRLCNLVDTLKLHGVGPDDVDKLERAVNPAELHAASEDTSMFTAQYKELAAAARSTISSSGACLNYRCQLQPAYHSARPSTHNPDPLPFDVEVHQLPSGYRMVLDTHRLLIPDVAWIQWMEAEETMPCIWGIRDGRIVTSQRKMKNPAALAIYEGHEALAGELNEWIYLDCLRDEAAGDAREIQAIRFSGVDITDHADTGCKIALGYHASDKSQVAMVAIISHPAWYYRHNVSFTCLLPPESAPHLREIESKEIESKETGSKETGSKDRSESVGLCPDKLMEMITDGKSDGAVSRAAELIRELYRRAYDCVTERYRTCLTDASNDTEGDREFAAAGRSSRRDAATVESNPAKLRAVLKRTMHSLGLGLRHVRLLVEQLKGPEDSVMRDRIRKALSYGCKHGSIASRSLKDLCACVRSKDPSLDAQLVDFATTAAACFASKGILFDAPPLPLSAADDTTALSRAHAAACIQASSRVTIATPCFGADFASSHGIHQQNPAKGVAALINELAHVQRVGGNGEIELLEALCDLAARSSGLKAIQIAAAMRCTVGQVDPLMQLARITTGSRSDGAAEDDAAIDGAMAHVIRVLKCLKRCARFNEALVVSGTMCGVILATNGKRSSRYARYASILYVHAEILREAEKGGEALRCFRLCEEVYSEVRGFNSLGAVTAMRCQAEVLQGMGKFEDALQKYEDCADRCSETGEEYSRLEFAAVLCGWASCLDDTNDFKLAGRMYQYCMDIRKPLLGEAHPDYADTLNDLAIHQQEQVKQSNQKQGQGLQEEQGQHRYQEAVRTFEKCCQITETCYGKGHPDYVASLANMANCLRMNGDYVSAYERYSEAVNLAEQAAGNPSWQTGKLMSSKAACQFITGLGKPEEALELFWKADTILNETGRVDENPSYYADHLENMAECLDATGGHREAVYMYRKCLHIRKSVLKLGQDHPYFVTVQHNLALSLERQKDIEEASEKDQAGVSVSSEAYGGGRESDSGC